MYLTLDVCCIFSSFHLKVMVVFPRGHFQKGRIRFLLNGVEPRYCTKCKIRFVKEITHCENCGKKIGKSSHTYDSVWIIFRRKEKQ